MEMIRGIKERRSIRSFTDQPVPDEVWQEIVSAASYAPSWKNTQICRYTVLRDREKIDELASTAVMGFEHNAEILRNCPSLVVLSYQNGRCGYERDGSFSTSKGDRWQMFDAGIAAQTFCLAASAYGVGTVILGIFEENEIAKRIYLPEQETVAALIAAGYPNETPQAPKRKSVEELLRFEENQ